MSDGTKSNNTKTDGPRISYIDPAGVDDDMKAELARCAQFGTPPQAEE